MTCCHWDPRGGGGEWPSGECARVHTRLYLLFLCRNRKALMCPRRFSAAVARRPPHHPPTPPKKIIPPPMKFCISVPPVTSVLYFLCLPNCPESVCVNNFGGKKCHYLLQVTKHLEPSPTRKTVTTGLQGQLWFFRIIHWKNVQEEM